MDPLPYVNQAYSIIIREECHRMVVCNKEERAEDVAFAAHLFDKSSVVCHVCNKAGLSATQCYQIIGYPERWGDKFLTSNGGRGGSCGGRTGRGRGGRGNYGGNSGRAQAALTTVTPWTVGNSNNIPWMATPTPLSNQQQTSNNGSLTNNNNRGLNNGSNNVTPWNGAVIASTPQS